MSKNSKENGQVQKKATRTPVQQARWENTYKLLRQHTNASEEEASEFADRKVAVVEQIERERELARS